MLHPLLLRQLLLIFGVTIEHIDDLVECLLPCLVELLTPVIERVYVHVYEKIEFTNYLID